MAPRLDINRPPALTLSETLSFNYDDEETSSSCWSPLPVCAVSNHEHAPMSASSTPTSTHSDIDNHDDIWDSVKCRLTVSGTSAAHSDYNQNDKNETFSYYIGQDKPKKQCRRKGAILQMSSKSMKDSFRRTKSQRRLHGVASSGSRKEGKKQRKAANLILDTATMV